MLLFNNRYGEYDKNVNNNYNNINEFRGVDLSISYKNKYENYLKQLVLCFAVNGTCTLLEQELGLEKDVLTKNLRIFY